MKKHILILVMLLITAIAFTQPSRRTTNNTRPAGNERRTEKTDDKKKPEVRKTETRPQNKNSVNQPREAGNRDVRPQTRPSGQSQDRPARSEYSNTNRERPAGNKPSGQSQDRPTRPGYSDSNRERPADGRPSGQNQDRPTRPGYSDSDRERPADGRPEGPDMRREERPGGPGDIKTTRPPERRDNVVRQPDPRPGVVNERPPQYHSSRKFVEPRPVRYHYKRPPRPREYRAKRYPYRRPPLINIYWSLDMHHDYIRFYPVVKTWRYPVGYRIPVISAYDALNYNGEVVSVYGKIYEVFYSAVTDEYFLYFGAYYPYHDFTVVMPGWIARRFSSYPEGYFKREYVIVTGLITSFNDSPEIVVQGEGQLRLY